MYAVNGKGYRVVSDAAQLLPGETAMTVLPDDLVARLKVLEARSDRDLELLASDWTQMADAPLTALEKAAYQTYRQALRDLPSAPGFPDVPWPPVPVIKDGAASNGQGTIHP